MFPHSSIALYAPSLSTAPCRACPRGAKRSGNGFCDNAFPPEPPHDGRHKDRATKVGAPASPSRCCPAFVVLRRPSAQLFFSPCSCGPHPRAIDVTDLFNSTCLVHARFDLPPVAPLLYLELLLLLSLCNTINPDSTINNPHIDTPHPPPSPSAPSAPSSRCFF
jgi:hypothetical protein